MTIPRRSPTGPAALHSPTWPVGVRRRVRAQPPFVVHGLLVTLMAERHHVCVNRATVRRWLHQECLKWRRPRPVLRPVDPEREAKLRVLRRLLRNLPDNEIAVFPDEVDVNLDPKIGCMWMPRGQQAVVETPRKNENRYLAGSLNWRTGHLIVTEGLPREERSTALFVRHLAALCQLLRRNFVIHVICENASFHDSRAVRAYLAEHGVRIRIHFLPNYAPETNPIERVWWHLHEEIPRRQPATPTGEESIE